MRTDIILVLTLFTLTLVSCDRRPVNDEPLWTMTAEQRDSATFARTRHFQTGYNFLVTSDSLPLYAEIPSFPSGFISADSVMVYAKEPLVVAEVRRVPAEGHPAYWIKVARDQSSMGWTSESHLMRSVVPVDPISRFIHAFSNRRLVAGAVILACMSVVMFYRKVRRGQMRMVLFRDIRSFYPTALCLATAVAAVLYRSVLAFSHDAWTAFYYEPSLNPFLWPPLLGAVSCRSVCFYTCFSQYCHRSVYAISVCRRVPPVSSGSGTNMPIRATCAAIAASLWRARAGVRVAER